MVDRSDLPKINALYGERNNLQQTLKLVDEGARIIAVTWGKQSESAPHFWQFTATTNTEYMDYPPQMVEAYKAFLHQRLTQITAELAQLGVTGLEPEPAAPQAARARRR